MRASLLYTPHADLVPKDVLERKPIIELEPGVGVDTALPSVDAHSMDLFDGEKSPLQSMVPMPPQLEGSTTKRARTDGLSTQSSSAAHTTETMNESDDEREDEDEESDHGDSDGVSAARDDGGDSEEEDDEEDIEWE
jgi:hypothetical protein